MQTSFVWIGIVPPAAKVICHLREAALSARSEWPEWARRAVLSLELPFSWQLLFWAAVLFTAATVLFGLFCPRIVRDHPDFGSFKGAGKELAHLFTYAEQMAGAETTPVPTLESSAEYRARRVGKGPVYLAYDLQYGPPATLGFIIEEDDSHLGDAIASGHTIPEASAYWIVLDAASSHSRGAFYLSALFYAGGLGCTFLLFAQNLVWVMRVASS